jgi:hypothetical protein
MRKTTLVIATFAVVTLLFTPSATLVAQSSRTVIATGLDNPRGLGFGPDGALYVVEAGRGGSSSLCLPMPDAPGLRCYGASGAVTRVTGIGIQQRVVVGLPSLAGASGDGATGPHDIGFGFGSAWLTVGLAADPAVRAPLEAAGVQLGRLVRILPNGQFISLLDLSAHEAAANPDGGAVDSNPYGLQFVPSGAVFTDAGGNALINIAATGAMSTLAVFPNRTATHPFTGATIPMQAVPTTVVRAPDGSFFVGELTGFPFPVGGARVYRVPAGGGIPQVVATGFTNIIDIAATAAGGYVLEHDADGLLGPGLAGRLVRVNADLSQTVLTGANLVKPGGIAIGPDGALYVTNFSTSAGGGEVVRIVP